MVDSFDVAHVVVIAAASTVEGLLPCLVSITMYVSPTPLDLKYRRDSQTFLPPYPSFVKFIPSPIQYLSFQSNHCPPSPLLFLPSLTQPFLSFFINQYPFNTVSTSTNKIYLRLLTASLLSLCQSLVLSLYIKKDQYGEYMHKLYK
jgi:hypothetical protein